MPNDDDDIQKRVEVFEKNLPDDQRNPHAKEAFDELTRHAAQPPRSTMPKWPPCRIAW